MGVATVALKMGEHGLGVDNRRRAVDGMSWWSKPLSMYREGGSHNGIEMIRAYELWSESSWM